MEDAYEAFTGYKLPKIEIIPINIDLQESNKNGFGVPAKHKYNRETGKHTIYVWRQLWEPQLHGKSTVFHELTHAYDFEKYVKGDAIR